MVNYRVEDLHAMVKVLKDEGCHMLEKIDDSEHGTIAWVMVPEAKKAELWQPRQGQRAGSFLIAAHQAWLDQPLSFLRAGAIQGSQRLRPETKVVL